MAGKRRGFPPVDQSLRAQVLAALANLACRVYSGQTGTIDGQFVDGDGRALVNAIVVAPATDLSAVTDRNRNFSLCSLAPDQIAVRASMLGYRTGEQRVRVEPGAESRANLSLNQQLSTRSRLLPKTKHLTDTAQRELYGNTYDQATAPLHIRKREEFGCTAVSWIRCSI